MLCTFKKRKRKDYSQKVHVFLGWWCLGTSFPFVKISKDCISINHNSETIMFEMHIFYFVPIGTYRVMHELVCSEISEEPSGMDVVEKRFLYVI